MRLIDRNREDALRVAANIIEIITTLVFWHLDGTWMGLGNFVSIFSYKAAFANIVDYCADECEPNDGKANNHQDDIPKLLLITSFLKFFFFDDFVLFLFVLPLNSFLLKLICLQLNKSFSKTRVILRSLWHSRIYFEVTIVTKTCKCAETWIVINQAAAGQVGSP